ncbi:MMPL family transporter [Arthrobacter crystallopoietes]|uniref:Putative drug exporter of the RND superfamily n=1 Tax=Crystallibacter crystallopoietes TaxID=37928 RepID=A0A1H1F5Q0_9MICC|nr:MMPL family transporter [Arthrobacter crystallopoietes]AUI49622.1 RND transporter [Arthrobacter crystallopoietes]SDQ96238.1 putative drug exporter of the RND superfamily [Arthrobacter crystallopoietes]
MASLLYSLGKFAARKRWWFVSAWLAIMVAVGGSLVAFSGTLSNTFTIPGTPAQGVLDELKEKMPEASGGLGTIVFTTEDGTAFTAEQEDAITAISQQLTDNDAVKSATDPLELQRSLDDAPEMIDDGEAELESAKQQLEAGQAELDAGKAQLAPAQQQLETAEAQIQQLEAAGQTAMAEQARAQLEPQRAQLEAAQAQLAEAEQQLEDGRAEYESGVAELEAAKLQQQSSEGLRFVSEDGSAAFVQVQFEQPMMEVAKADRDQVQQITEAGLVPGLQAEYSKDIVEDISQLFGAAEIIGIAVAAAVLILMLGTLIAAGLPLLMAVIGVGVGVGGTMALSGVVEMSSISPVLALMLGLAVGIDYSLFIVNRHRTQLLSGVPLVESIGRATGTSGNAVLFAGLTVIIALAALAVPGIPFLTVLGLAGAATVAVAVVVALTLTPAMLSIMGKRILSTRAWARAGMSGPVSENTVQTTTAGGEFYNDPKRSWGKAVTRHSWLSLVAGVAVLGLMAVPAAELRLGLPDGSSEPADSTAYQAYTQLGENFGEGINGPLIIVADLPEGLEGTAKDEALLELSQELRAMDHVSAAVPTGTSEDGRTAVLQVIPEEGPAAQSTEDLVHNLRAEADALEASTGVGVSLTGQPAMQIDVSDKLADAMPVYLAIVIGLSLILLLLVFRSILVPLLATAGFLLSLGASFGAVVAIYQWGWLSEVFGVHHPGPILSFLPMILIGVLFGLAMDYQMFLVSGMRESFAHGEDARAAVVSGFNHGAKVVTAAAIIMVSVFAGFIFSHLTMVRPIGFALALGVLLDAFVVRMTLIPAAMHLLGKSAWWMPNWLDKILPDVDVEGAKLVPTGSAATPADGATDTLEEAAVR